MVVVVVVVVVHHLTMEAAADVDRLSAEIAEHDSVIDSTSTVLWLQKVTFAEPPQVVGEAKWREIHPATKISSSLHHIFSYFISFYWITGTVTMHLRIVCLANHVSSGDAKCHLCAAKGGASHGYVAVCWTIEKGWVVWTCLNLQFQLKAWQTGLLPWYYYLCFFWWPSN